MGNKTWMGVLCTSAALAMPLAGQERQAGRVIRVPFERGVYYDGSSGPVALRTTVFLPFLDVGLKDLLGLGSPKLIAVMPGAHAPLSITNSRPTFYLRGHRPGNQTYLFRGIEKDDRRELRMSPGREITEWPQIRGRDVSELEIEPLAGDLAALRPRSDLSAGEYVILCVLEPGYRAIRLAYDFGVFRATARP
jgi:hypothetical protein